MLYWYSLAAPVDPPDPPVPVTVPVLNPAQTILPSPGLAVPRVGAVGAEATVHVQIVLHEELLQP